MNSDKLRESSGAMIPPYRMAQLVKVSSKLVDLMVTGVWGLTYPEMKVVLDIIGNAMERSSEHVLRDNEAEKADERSL